MVKYSNSNNIPLAIAVLLATDNYDHDENTISATKLLRPLRQLILADRVPQSTENGDISNRIASSMGTAVHRAAEEAWVTNYKPAMLSLGYPQSMVDNIVINPSVVKEGEIPVYLERRTKKEILGYVVSGMFDFVMNGDLEDIKRTSTYTYTNNTKEEDYTLQGSIYRWLNPEIITGDFVKINYVFSDWSNAGKYSNPNYPQQAILGVSYPLLSLQETETWIRTKLAAYTRLKDQPQELLPLCTDKELWRGESHWKYYKNPSKTSGRSTKNFDSKLDAYDRKATDGNVGIVIEKPAEVKACRYCPAFAACTQKDAYLADGTLKIT